MIEFDLDALPMKNAPKPEETGIFFDIDALPAKSATVPQEKSITQSLRDGLAYVGRVLSGEEYNRAREEFSQKVQSDINQLPEGTQKENSQALHDASQTLKQGMDELPEKALDALGEKTKQTLDVLADSSAGRVIKEASNSPLLNEPITYALEGADAAQEAMLKQKALDLIAKADSLDESSLYSKQIKELWDYMGDRIPTAEEAQKLEALKMARLKGYDALFEKEGLGEFGIDQKTGEKYLIKDGKNILLDDSLIDAIQAGLKADAGVAVGAMSGAYQAAKMGKTPQQMALLGLGGGMAGAFVGSGVDTGLNAYATDKEIDAKLALRKASEEAVVDGLLTLLTAGTIHVAGKPLKFTAEKAGELATKLKHYVIDANLDGASNVLKQQGYNQEAIDAINAGVSKFQNAPQEVKGARDNIVSKTIGSITDKVENFAKADTKKIQDSFVNVAQQDDTLAKQMVDVLSYSPELSKRVGEDISNRSTTLEKALEKHAINPWEVRAKIEAYEQGVKAEYAQTKELIQEAIPEARFSLKSTNIPQTIHELEQSIGDTNVKNELLALSHRIAKKEELNAYEFIDVREDINRILGKPSVKAFVDKEALNGIKQTLDESLHVAFKDAPIDASSIKTQFEQALSRYSDMKSLQDTYLYEGIMGKELSLENVASALERGAHTQDATLDRMLSKLSPADREKVEYSVIINLYKKNQDAFGNDFKATDFVKLGEDLSKLPLKNIQSESARKTINDLKEMSRYFKNDQLFMEKAGNARQKIASQGISPDPFSRLRTRMGNMIADMMVKYSLVGAFLGGSTESAFRYHLKQSLKRSRSPIDFISDVTKHKDIPPSLLQNLQGALKEYQKEALKETMTPKEAKEATQVQGLIDTMQKRLDKIIVDESKGAGKTTDPNWRFGDAEFPLVPYKKEEVPAVQKNASFVPPTPQELKAVESLSDLATQKALIHFKEGKPTEYAIKKYKEAVEKIGQARLSEEVERLHVKDAQRLEKQNTLLAHPRVEELLRMREGVDASQTRYANTQVGKGGLMEDGSFVKDTHAPNYVADFELTKSGVARIRKGGEINEGILDALERDLGRLDNDPNYKKGFVGSPIANTIVSGGAGSTAPIDYNQDGEVSMEERALSALLASIGMNVPGLMRNAGKTMQKAKEMPNGMRNGMITGAKDNEAGAFSDIATKKVMREIDDSGAATTKGTWGTSEDMARGNTTSAKLGEILTHDSLFEKYPALKNVNVRLVKDMKGASIEGNKIAVGYKNNGEIDIDSLLHEVQHAVQEIDSLPRGGSKEMFIPTDGVKKQVEAELEGWTKMYNEAFDKLSEAIAKGDEKEIALRKSNLDWHGEKLSDIQKNIDLQKDPRGSYLKLYGEQQARATAYRKDMTPEQRAKESWQQTLERVEGKYEEPIIRYDDVVMMSDELEKKYLLKDGSINENALKKDSEPFRKLDYTKENFTKEFPSGKIQTDYGEVYISPYQFNKLKEKGRERYFGLIKPTLQRPTFVVDFEDKTVFFKAFKDEKGVVKFSSFAKDGDGVLDVTSNYVPSNKKFELFVREGEKVLPEASVVRPSNRSSGNEILPQTENSVNQDTNILFSRGALSAAGIANGVTIEEDGSITFDSQDALKGMAIGAGLEIFGSRLLKGGHSTMRRGSIGIRPDENSVRLYAKANEVISQKMANKMDASALKSMLKNAGVKDEEMVWSGLNELSGTVSKAEVQERLNASALQLNEIIKNDATTQKYIAYTEAGGTNYKEYLLTLPQITPTFRSNHWEENNVVAFMRTKDRNLDGQKSLFVEEIQSDLHQEGRKQGYGTHVPEAPFKTTWHELAFKRIIKEAVENGYDSIAWTTAKQQEKRYSLTKSLKELSYKQNSDGTYTLELSHQNGAKDKRAYIAPIDLQDHIGQNLAKRVLEGEGEGTLKQEALEIGSKGMQVFYDTMMPLSVKKLLKTQPRKVTMEDGQEVWMAKISKERKQSLIKEGLPLYTTIGGTFGIGASAYGTQQ